MSKPEDVDIEVKVKVEDSELEETIEKIEKAKEKAKELEELLEVIGQPIRLHNKVSLDGETLYDTFTKLHQKKEYQKNGTIQNSDKELT